MATTPEVDLVLLTRDEGPLHPDVERGIRRQRGVRITLHRVIGRPRPEDRCRWDAIARARNAGKACGRARYLMFLDDDVVLEPSCVAALVDELSRRPAFAALAADYRGETRSGFVARHVSMGATMFRRDVLGQIQFTWRERSCECQCCCDDLRRLHWAIDYVERARARHLTKNHCGRRPEAGAVELGSVAAAAATGYVLTAFNRGHLRPFRDQFLHSLRAKGNKESVLALALGLYPSERRELRRLAGVTPHFRDDDGRKVARQRLMGFHDILRRLPPQTFVAYWDAGDVIFQSKLQPLWELVRAHPDKLLVVREPLSHPQTPTVASWTRGIIDPAARREVRRLLYPRPWLNGGFIAGAAAALAKYFRTVANWYDTPKLAGSSNRGDQLALNVYCHSHPDAWHEAPEGWNYCLCRRDLKTVSRRLDGRYVDVRKAPIYVVHGNGGHLRDVRFQRTPL